MCGIAGFVNTHMDGGARKTAILGMNERMIHRGPDAGDLYIDGERGVVFGHRRLSIQDLTQNASQPMLSHNDRFVMIYNGEIYNAPELRDRLQSEGLCREWRSTSDTEILLEAISAYGMGKALKYVKGMFAVAVYDRSSGEIHLARDRVGEKPLYYGYVRGALVFASDIAAIRAYPDFDNEIDREAIGLYLRYGYIPTPKSIYKNIYKLEPGTIMTFSTPYDQGKKEVYYDLKDEYAYAKGEERFAGSMEDAVDELEDKLRNAVRSQLLSDVPLGAFLSGGIDSSVTVSLMQSISDSPVKTFTIGFEEKAYDESDAAGMVAKALGTDHTCLTVTEKDLTDVIPKMADIFSEPFADSSEIPTYLVSKLAGSRVTVALSGDAGDELFAGYNTYWKTAGLYEALKRFPRGAKRLAGRMNIHSSNNNLYRTAHCLLAEDIAGLHEAVCYDMTAMSHITALAGDMYDSMRSPKLLLKDELYRGQATPEDEMMLRDMLRYHPDDILVKVDRAGMAVSLENRVPMLDRDVLKLAYSIPTRYKLSKDGKGTVISKRVLKEVLYRYVPKELVDRPKKGFSVPLERWLYTGSVHDMVWELLTGSRLVLDGYIEREWLDRLMRCFMTKKENKSLLWSVFVLEQWYRRYHGQD